MKTTLYKQDGTTMDSVELPEGVFGLRMNQDLMHQVVVGLQANARQSIAHTKGRGEVRGGGKKPWRQKGTGRARHASIRSPIWKGGGVTFGPTSERNFSQKINKKMKRRALYMALSSKANIGNCILLNQLSVDPLKTKTAQSILKHLMSSALPNNTAKYSVLLITPDTAKDVRRVTKNLPNVLAESVNELNILDVLKYSHLILLKDALPFLKPIS